MVSINAMNAMNSGFTASMWAEVNALQKAFSMSGKYRSKQRVERFLNELEQGTASLTDEELARLDCMIRERRGRAAVHFVVAPIDIAQPCNPRSSSEILFDVRVYMEGNNEGRMDPERGQLESPSAGTGLKYPDNSASRTGKWNEPLSTAACSPA